MCDAVVRFMGDDMSAKEETERERQWDERVAPSRPVASWEGGAESPIEVLFYIIFIFILELGRRGTVSLPARISCIAYFVRVRKVG